MDNNLERLRSIKTFPSLVKYLRDELDWPIESDDVEDLSFDYEPEELGLDSKTAVKIKEIKQLRPFVTGQPWGIFFISFEPKRLPIVALRRILRSLVIKKRQSSSKSQQATWQLDDLLFISSYGESEEREISFAHFSDDDSMGDLPTLKVLGWNAQNTVLRLEDTQQVLKEKLQWPEDENDAAAWRKQWSSAFKLQYRETVRTSKDLAIKLADLATLIRARVNDVLEVESESGELRKLYKAFQEALIHDLTEDDFADMYAQTIAYGLLTASISRQSGGLVADNLKDMVPNTNPFLKELMQTFLTVGGRKGKIDFDELGINDVVELLRHTQMDEVLKDFGAKNPQEDPVIHFYEHFLKEYDPEKRMKRGVFYTPRPVVSFIVRSVDDILRTEFGLLDGLADTTTWGEMTKRHERLNIPEGAEADDAFVQILDPATGTGTFLVEVIDRIFTTLRAKWQKQDKSEREMYDLWNDYVPRHLLPRLHGFELMMAPYAIAHMKIGLKLRETHYSFLSSERARVYLTNTLEEPKDFSAYFEQMAPALAHEAEAANKIKRTTAVTIVVGNPPYAGLSSNLGAEPRRIIDRYRYIDGERLVERGALQFEKNLQDDYVKFFAWSEARIRLSSVGVLALITNSGFLDTPTLRGMRWSLLNTFGSLEFLDLHGSTKRPIASDENVFDIQQGVAISVLYKSLTDTSCEISRADFVGSRESKYSRLSDLQPTNETWRPIVPLPPLYQFLVLDQLLQLEYQTYCYLPQIMPFYSSGTETGFDFLLVNFTREELEDRVKRFLEQATADSDIKAAFRITGGTAQKLLNARSEFRSDYRKNGAQYIVKGLYRVFDKRFYYLKKEYLKTNSFNVMEHLRRGSNLALIAFRQQSQDGFHHAFVTRELGDKNAVSLRTREINYYFPLYLYDRGILIKDPTNQRRVNYSNLPKWMVVQPESFFAYSYAVLYSPQYRTRYSDFLKSDYPRIPITSDSELFDKLSALGADLIALHLLDDDYEAASWTKLPAKRKSPLKTHITRFTGRGGAEVAKGHPKFKDGNVYINPEHYFEGVPEEVWNFHIGGYQVCEKWLKDRRGRILSEEDINHYQRVVVALNQTIRLMAEIDRVIEEHGGWPLVGSQEGVSSVAVPSTSDHHEVDQSEPLPFE